MNCLPITSATAGGIGWGLLVITTSELRTHTWNSHRAPIPSLASSLCLVLFEGTLRIIMKYNLEILVRLFDELYSLRVGPILFINVCNLLPIE